MLIQRLKFRAVTGKLQVIAIWRCLAKSHAKVCRWSMDVDRITGAESMTVDLVESGPLCAGDIAATLDGTRTELTITLFHLEVVSNPGATQAFEKEEAYKAADSCPNPRPDPGLTLVTDITRRIAQREQD
ncbi:KY49.ctg7180000000025_quiver, whole genome shotgun sequence [Burkholderia multivorans]